LQAVDQCAVGRRQRLHRPGREHRETEDHPGDHQRQAFDLFPGRPLFPPPQQQQRRRHRRKQRTAQAVEQRMDFLHDNPCEGQGEAEDDDAE